MLSLSKILIDGLIISAIAMLILLVIGVINPRMMLNDYPEAIKALVPDRTPQEKKQGLFAGIILMLVLFGGPLLSTLQLSAPQTGSVSFWTLFLHAAGVTYIFNIVDWLIIDWLIFCTITPKFMVIPGTEGNPAYKDYGFHFRGFLIGTVFSLFAGLLVGGTAWLIGLL